MTFEHDLTNVINKHGIDARAGVADYILAEMVSNCLKAVVRMNRQIDKNNAEYISLDIYQKCDSSPAPFVYDDVIQALEQLYGQGCAVCSYDVEDEYKLLKSVIDTFFCKKQIG